MAVVRAGSKIEAQHFSLFRIFLVCLSSKDKIIHKSCARNADGAAVVLAARVTTAHVEYAAVFKMVTSLMDDDVSSSSKFTLTHLNYRR